MSTPFKPVVGAQRIGELNTAEKYYTLETRKQMQKIIKEYKRWLKHLDDSGADILYDALKPTFELSQKIVPVKTGELKKSGYLEKRKFRGKPQVIMGYAKGGKPNYAAIVHERLDYFHARPGQAKYLEHAILADASNIRKRLEQGFKKAANV